MNALKNFWDLRSKKQRLWIVVLLSVIALSIIGSVTGAGDSSTTGGTESGTSEIAPTKEADSRTAVEWEDYAPTVKTNIDALMEAKDCVGLQKQFDITDSNNDATMSRTGHNNAKLMMYEMEAMKIAGCSE